MAVVLFSCRSTADMLSDGQPIPFLNEAYPEIIEIVDNADPFEEIGQRIIWKIHKNDGLTSRDIIDFGMQNLFGGLILNGFSIDEYNSIRSQLDTLTQYPLIFGTEEPILLNNQFSGVDQQLPALMMLAIKEDRYHEQIDDFLYDQMAVLGINFTANFYSSKYETNSIGWNNYFDLRQGNSERYRRRLSVLNQRRTLTAYNYFDQKIEPKIDSIGQIEHRYNDIISLVQKGLSSIIVNPAVFRTNTESLSTFFRETLNFNGILMTKLDSISNIEKALDAGMDMFIVEGPDVRTFHDQLSASIGKRYMSMEEIYASHRKLLLAKYWMNNNSPKELTNYQLWMDIPGINKIDEFSTTLVRNYKNLLPLTHTYKRDIRLLSYGPSTLDTMESIMRLFADHKRNFYNSTFQKEFPTFNLSRYRFATIIVTLDSIRISPIKDSTFIAFINDLSQTRKVALVNFGNPENLISFDSTVTQLQIYRRNAQTESLAAHILYGGAAAKGEFPIMLGDHLVKGMHVEMPITRWRYVNCKDNNINEDELDKIRIIANEGIRRKAFPGCQIFAAKDGQVILNSAFGRSGYKDKHKLENSDIYDLASVTKVAATTLSIMRLVEKGWIGLEDRLSKYLSLHDTLDLNKVKIRDLLTHRSGIQANVPTQFIIEYKDTSEETCNLYRCDSLSESHSYEIAKHVYYSNITQDSLWAHVSALSANKGNYKYSDVNFYLLQRVIEEVTEMKLNTYVDREFYQPLGLRNCSFQPLSRFSKDRIVPTEQDKKWRAQILQGYVHDPTAALLGGISGNAGLFSNAHDIAVIGQLLLNKGKYGGIRYFKEETVELFTQAKFSKNRGLGFDSNNNGTAKVGRNASRSTYGHLGFTGTCIWMDPAENLVYVFLSNRIHPNQKNNKINKYRYRQRIHDVIYSAIEKGSRPIEQEPEIRAIKASLVSPDQ